jgi:hypothetical protein
MICKQNAPIARVLLQRRLVGRDGFFRVLVHVRRTETRAASADAVQERGSQQRQEREREREREREKERERERGRETKFRQHTCTFMYASPSRMCEWASPYLSASSR